MGMEWKEHVAWIAPISVTMAAYVLRTSRRTAKNYSEIRMAVLTFVIVAVTSSGIAAVFGAMITKHAPVDGGSIVHLVKNP